MTSLTGVPAEVLRPCYKRTKGTGRGRRTAWRINPEQHCPVRWVSDGVLTREMERKMKHSQPEPNRPQLPENPRRCIIDNEIKSTVPLLLKVSHSSLRSADTGHHAPRSQAVLAEVRTLTHGRAWGMCPTSPRNLINGERKENTTTLSNRWQILK